MHETLEICANASAHIVAQTKGKLPDSDFWHVVEKVSDLVTKLRLYIAGRLPPAFAYVDITCSIPPTSIGKRELFLETRSEALSELDYPIVGLGESEIPNMLKEEEKRLGYSPGFTLKARYGGAARLEGSKALEISFDEMAHEVDIAAEERHDYESIAVDVFEQIEAIHRVFTRIRASSEQSSGD